MILTAVIFVGFALRLADWQLLNGGEYKEIAESADSVTQTVKAVRGEITDRSGKALVTNVTRYEIVLDRQAADGDELNALILKLTEILDATGDERTDDLPLTVSSSGCKYKSGEENEEKIARILSDELLNFDEDTSADECFAALAARYDADENLTAAEKAAVVSVRLNMELCESSDEGGYVLAENVSDETVAKVSEGTQGVSGAEVKAYTEREAADPDLAPHILGALGAITADEYQTAVSQGKDYDYDDRMGKFGVELACEDELRGEDGTQTVSANADGTTQIVETKKAEAGSTVYLTLDYDVQAAAAKALAENVTSAQKATGGDESDCRAGAAVMLSVDDFSVLAAASYPTYDLNKYSEYGSYYVSLAENDDLPLYNRAAAGTFACGSAFKPCVAAGALEEGIITDEDEIYCKQSYDYYPNDIVNCMHYHGSLNLYGAMARSCNYFFADVGRRLGIDKIAAYAESFGLGEYTGIEIEESKGTLAGRDSAQWQEGSVVSAAIGQSDNAFTPLQLAAYAAVLATGERMKVHIVSKVTDYERTQTVKSYEAQSLGKCGVSEENLEIVRKAMLGVCEDANGTAYSVFGNYAVKVAAKTGTAENSGGDHAVFICFAPYENPQVAAAVVIEHGESGKYAMQTAKAMLDAYFGT